MGMFGPRGAGLELQDADGAVRVNDQAVDAAPHDHAGLGRRDKGKRDLEMAARPAASQARTSGRQATCRNARATSSKNRARSGTSTSSSGRVSRARWSATSATLGGVSHLPGKRRGGPESRPFARVTGHVSSGRRTPKMNSARPPSDRTPVRRRSHGAPLALRSSADHDRLPALTGCWPWRLLAAVGGCWLASLAADSMRLRRRRRRHTRAAN